MTCRKPSIPTPSRRAVLAMGGGALAGLGGFGLLTRRARARVLIVGGGPGGSHLALRLRLLVPDLQVTLVERDPARLAAAPGHTWINQRRPGAGFAVLDKAGVHIALDDIRTVDWSGRQARALSGRYFDFDLIAMAPGIAPRPEPVAGYDAMAAHECPHGWSGHASAQRLATKIAAMRPGGTMLMRIPASNLSCPQAPYERAERIAGWLKRHNPRARLILLDGKTGFAGQATLLRRWQQRYGAMVEWIGAREGGTVTAIDARAGRLTLSGGSLSGDVISYIPAQLAGNVAARTGLVDSSLWCPVSGPDGRSARQAAAFVLGDAVAGGDERKLASRACARAEACARTMARLLAV